MGITFRQNGGENITEMAEPVRDTEQIIAEAQRLVGRVLNDKFKLTACIGIGGSGAVYRADQIALHRTVAVKILNHELTTDDRLVKRFQDEATSSSSLNHPNTVSIIDFGQTDDNLLYLAMEYVRGPTLTQLLQKASPIPATRVLDIVAQILAGTEEAHLAGVVHADLKCDNVIVDQRRAGVDMVKIVDFGIARLANAPREGEEKMVCGTPEYMSPEVIRGEAPGFAADQYAIGIIFYELLTGVTPFLASKTVEILTNHLKGQIKPLVSHRKELSDPRLDALVAKALAKRPTDRFASVGDMRVAVLETLAQMRSTTLDACASCGAMSAPSFKFCPECGASRARPSKSFEAVTVPRTENERFPFFGRHKQLQTVRAFMLRGNSSTLDPMVICGTAGSGKTTLLQHVYESLPSGTVTIFQTGPDPSGLQAPYYPVRSLLASLLGLFEVCGERDVESAVIELGMSQRDVPGILQTFGYPTGLLELEPLQRRREIVTSVRRAVSAVAAAKPMAVVMEDVDAYDAPSFELIRRVFAKSDVSVPMPPVVLTAKPPVGLRLNKDPIVLTALPSDAIKEIIEARNQKIDLSMLLVQSGGLPGRIEQLLRFAASGGNLTEAGQNDGDIIAARLAFVQQSTMQVLQAIAVNGLECSAAMLSDLLPDVSLAQQQAGIEDAKRLGMVEVLTDDSIIYPSLVIRDVVYATTPADVRRHLHNRAAQHLVQTTDNALLLGHHYELGGQSDVAVDYFIASGQLASQQLDDTAAVEIYQRALLTVRQTLRAGDGVEKSPGQFVDISIRLAEMLKDRGQSALARGLLAEAQTWAERGIKETAIDRCLASISVVEGDTEAAINITRRAIGKAMSIGAMSVLCDLYVDLATLLMRTGQLDLARNELGECIDVVTLGEGATATDGPDALWRVLRLNAQLTQTLGDSYRALRLAESALTHVIRVQSKIGAARVQAMLAVMCEKAGLAGKADRYRAAAIDQMRSLGDRRATAELLLADAPARALIATSRSEELQEASHLAAEIGWTDGLNMVLKETERSN